MPKGKIYSVFDKGEYIGSYTPDVAEMVIGIPQYRVQAYAKENLLYHIDIVLSWKIQDHLRQRRRMRSWKTI